MSAKEIFKNWIEHDDWYETIEIFEASKLIYKELISKDKQIEELKQQNQELKNQIDNLTIYADDRE